MKTREHILVNEREGATFLGVQHQTANDIIILQKSDFYGANRVRLNINSVKALHEALGKIIHDHETVDKYHEAYFAIDCDEVYYKGYTTGQTWNGWACPEFEFDAAQQLIENWNDYYTENQSYYDAEKDAFFMWDELNEEFDKIEGHFITIKGEQVKVYGIGSGWWCWMEHEKKTCATCNTEFYAVSDNQVDCFQCE